MDDNMKEKLKQICPVGMVAASAVGVISYFLPFAKFLISFSYFELVDGAAEGYVPVVFSVAALVMAALILWKYKTSMMIYICGIADTVALGYVISIMNSSEDIISGSDVAAIGYTVFIIAHVATFIFCLIYRLITEKEEKSVGAGKKPETARRPETATAAKAGKVCPSCGKSIDRDAAFCPYCGSNAAAPRPETVRRSGKTCPSCGSTVDEGAAFCPYCGSSTAAPRPRPEPAASRCPSCGSVLPYGSSVCPKCSRDESSSGSGWFISDDLD